MNSHERYFDKDLNELKKKLIHMAATAEIMIDCAIQELTERDQTVAEGIPGHEQELNRLQIEIDEMVQTLTATHQPVAVDLRFLLAATRINSELERIGDLVINITQTAPVLVRQPEIKPIIDIQRMAELARKMVRESLHAFVKGDAPSAQTVIATDDQVDALKDQVMRELLTYQGSRALVFCVDFSRLMATARYLGHQFNNDDMIGFVTAGIDTALAAQTVVVAAKSLGIDSLITNALHRKPLETVYQALKLPETSCFPLITVVLGYPREEPAYLKGRLSTEFIVHEGHYQAPDETQLPRIVAEYDDHDRHLGLIDNWEQQGFEHYLDWFYTKWCGLPDRQRVATGKIQEFQKRLAKSGFWWPTA